MRDPRRCERPERALDGLAAGALRGDEAESVIDPDELPPLTEAERIAFGFGSRSNRGAALDWKQLAALPEAELGRLDIAAVHLSCAVELPGAEMIDVPHCLARLDEWARHITGATQRFAPCFWRQPANYENSWAYFRVLAMVTILQRDLGVCYNPAKIPDDADFDTADTFIHGIIQGEGGTCASLPVVYVAVGRRLDYPLKLVHAAGHLFARWDEPGGERFNIEATNKGLTCESDDYYRTGRYAVTPGQEREGCLLRSQAPREELAGFLVQRGLLCLGLGWHRQATEAFVYASALVPDNKLHACCALAALDRWSTKLKKSLPANFPAMRLYFAPRRRFPTIPLSVEREVIHCEELERCLNDPTLESEWWDPMRRIPGYRPPTLPARLDIVSN